MGKGCIFASRFLQDKREFFKGENKPEKYFQNIWKGLNFSSYLCRPVSADKKKFFEHTGRKKGKVTLQNLSQF
jgi:hypothetical protein